MHTTNKQDVLEGKEETFSVETQVVLAHPPRPHEHLNNRGFDRESRSWHSFIRRQCHMAITSILHQGSGETYLFLWVSIRGLHFSIGTSV